MVNQSNDIAEVRIASNENLEIAKERRFGSYHVYSSEEDGGMKEFQDD